VRDVCRGFRVSPREFRRRTARRAQGTYYPVGDIVAFDPDIADSNGMGGEDGYYATLLREVLHATGHPRRLDRPTTVDKTYGAHALEEGTVQAEQAIVLREIAFNDEAIECHAIVWDLPVDRRAAAAAAAWVLR
jgi:antirestriction protein ArdC